MNISADRLKDFKKKNDDGSTREKSNTITFQESYKRCRRYISEIDENKSIVVNQTHSEKRIETLNMISDFVRSMNQKVDGFLDDDEALKEALQDEIVNYGILTDLIDPDNESVDEVQVNSLTEIFYVENGQKKKLDKSFQSNSEVRKIVEKLIEKGERLNHESPFVNARTVDGFRLNVIHPSISKNMCYGLTLRKQRKVPISEKDILKNGTVTRNMLNLMKLFPRSGVNWATVGGTGSGKTVLNNVLLPFLGLNTRAIYIENPAELRPEVFDYEGNVQNNFLQLEAKNFDEPRPSDPSMYNMLVNALRQTPEYIVPGEVRAPEEFDVALTAAQTGHNVFTTYHAEDPEDAIFRFLKAALKASGNTPAELLMRDICSAFRFIINVKQLNDGTRRVMYVTEVLPPEGLKVRLNHLYRYVVDRVEEEEDPNTGVITPRYFGRHVRQNAISPWFQNKLKEEGLPLERFEFFTKEPKKLRDEEGELILDMLGDPIVLEEEIEYAGKSPELDIEELVKEHKIRLNKGK